MNQKQHGRNMVPAGWQQVQSQPFEASQQAELQRPVNRSYKDMNITVQMYPCSEGTDTGSPAL